MDWNGFWKDNEFWKDIAQVSSKARNDYYDEFFAELIKLIKARENKKA